MLSMSSGHCFSGMSWKEKKVIFISLQRSVGPVQVFKANVAGPVYWEAASSCLTTPLAYFPGQKKIKSNPDLIHQTLAIMLL